MDSTKLKEMFPNSAVFVMGAPLPAAGAFSAGAKTSISKDIPISNFVQKITQALRYPATPVVEPVPQGGRINEGVDPRRSLSARMTPREREVLDLLTFGCTTSEIAAQLCIMSSTVRAHVHNILLKLGVQSRAQAVVAAADRGIVGARSVQQLE
jgi:DNA-binding NarL/FixJ family response regulator